MKETPNLYKKPLEYETVETDGPICRVCNENNVESIYDICNDCNRPDGLSGD